jgi:tRNA nucleotidyltransferase (CCA-adding enzyme)
VKGWDQFVPDYNFLMESRLSQAQSRVVNKLGRLAAGHGLNLYLVGGAVRDLTLGLDRPRDLNFVVAGNVDKLVRALVSSPRRKQLASPPGGPGAAEPIDLSTTSLKVDGRLGAAEVVFEDGIRADIASARNEVFNTPGRPPEMLPGSIFDDLRRRDFSVNAMAVSLHPNSRGLLLDPTNGAADIERRELRALHSRSFFDDPSRLYRLLRLGIRLDFKPDERTQRWLEIAMENKLWETMREQQQGRELRAILDEEHCGKVIKVLGERGLLAGLDRKLASARTDFDKFERIRAALRIAGSVDVAAINFLGLTARLGSADRARLAKKILDDAKMVKFVLGLDRDAARFARILQSAKASRPSFVYQVLAEAPRAIPVYLLVHYPQASVQSRVKNFLTKFPVVRARLPRAELETLGAPPGPKFEQVLERVFLDELDGKIRTPQQMTKALRDYAGIKPPPPPPPAPKAHAAKPAAALAPKAAARAAAKPATRAATPAETTPAKVSEGPSFKRPKAAAAKAAQPARRKALQAGATNRARTKSRFPQATVRGAQKTAKRAKAGKAPRTSAAKSKGVPRKAKLAQPKKRAKRR